jgi:hypothetical protein
MAFDHEKEREFERYSVSLKADVNLAGGYSETTVLRDVSGGGASFITTHPERYSIGDRVDITIRLPGGGSLHAKVKGAGKVASMKELGEGETTVGLRLDDLLDFDGMIGESE